MRRHVPMALTLALVLTSCSLLSPTATGNKPVTRVQKIQQVKELTQVFSLSKNAGLSTATTSVQALLQALSSAFAGISAVGSQSKLRVQSLDEALDVIRTAGLPGTYHVAGVATQGDATVNYDATGQVTSIVSPDAEVDLSVKTDGDTHTFTATIVKSPDGTTGTFTLSVTGTNWHGPAAAYQALQADPTPDASATPPPTPTASPTPTPKATSTATPTPQPSASWPHDPIPSDWPSLAPRPTPAPYHWFPNETPAQVSAVSVSLDVVPKGNAANTLKLTGSFDKPQTLLLPFVAGTPVPTHWKLTLSVPKVALTWESQLSMANQQLSFAADGTMDVLATSGTQHFTYDLKLDQATSAGELDLINTDAHVKLTIAGHQPRSGSPTVTTTLVSTDDGSKLGTVALDPAHPNVAVITFSDGSKQNWELFPASMLPGTLPALP